MLQVKLCFDGQKWDLLNETILSLSKKRLIIKVAIAKMVTRTDIPVYIYKSR